MKAEDLYDSIGTVDEDLLERSEQRGKEDENKTGDTKVRRLTPRMKALIAAAAVLIVCGVLAFATDIFRKNAGNPKNPDKVPRNYVLAGAWLPRPGMPNGGGYPDAEVAGADQQEATDAWYVEPAMRKALLAEYGQDKAYAAINQFTLKSMRTFLSGRSNVNKVYSPINIYLMLGMLAESTAGNSREQLLSLAGVDSIEDMRTLSKALWNRLYYEEYGSKCLLGASMWLDESYTGMYHKDTLNRLANEYYAASFMGKMGSKEYNELFQQWMNSMTGGMLENSVKALELRRDSLMALASTIYFVEQWGTPFEENQTKDLTFHAVSGDKTVPFMHEDKNGMYYRGEKYIAVCKWLMHTQMWLILPNEGVSVDELMDDPDLADLMSKSPDELDRTLIHLNVPKFDISDDPNLIKALQELGVTDIFDPGAADFSPLLDTEAYVQEANHSVRVQMDEEGVKAAALTEVVIAMGLDIPKEEEITVTFDRPFLFLVQSNLGEIPLFAGVVENP